MTGVCKSRASDRLGNKFLALAPNICGSSVYVTLRTPRIMRWLADFW